MLTLHGLNKNDELMTFSKSGEWSTTGSLQLYEKAAFPCGKKAKKKRLENKDKKKNNNSSASPNHPIISSTMHIRQDDPSDCTEQCVSYNCNCNCAYAGTQNQYGGYVPGTIDSCSCGSGGRGGGG